MMVLMLLGAFAPLAAHDPHCLPAAGRRWAVLVMEDHPGMREVVWDPAFTSPTLQGAFRPDHRYALRTTGTPALIDLGCWDEAFHYGSDHCGEHEGDDDGRDDHSGGSVVNVSWTGDRKGVILRVGGKSTWLPMLGPWDSHGAPAGTFRGAYLNWLLQNRPTTPSIPKETRWQRLQRGANALATQLLTRSGGAPEYRIEGFGASGRLLIPPGEGLPAALNAVSRMAPAAKGYALKDSLNGVVEMVRELKTRGGCQPGLVIVVSDGWGLGSTCATGSPYETQAQYPVLQQQATAIAATAQAAVWAWDVEGPSPWNPLLAAKGMGLSFDGDAVAALRASVQAWMQGGGQPPQVRLSLDQPALTRFAQATLTITVDRPLSSATLNGLPLSITALTTQLPQTLKEGLNTFSVKVQTPCGSNQASLTVTLDTVAPRIQLDPAPPALTNRLALRIGGRVDDPASALTLNGALVPLDAEGRFAVDAVLPQEGDNGLAFLARDAAGNEGRLEIHIQRDTLAPKVALSSPAEGLVTNAASIELVGQVDDPTAAVAVNGQAVALSGTAFTATASPAEGAFTFEVAAVDPAGNTAKATRSIHVDRTAPVITLDRPLPALTPERALQIAGRVDDPRASLLLNGQPLALDASGAFSTTLALVEGENTFRFLASDLAGNFGSLTAATSRDTTPPVVTLSSPEEGLVTRQRSLTVAGRVDDPSARLMVNGQSVSLAADGSFQAELTPPEGPLLLVALATDAAGNSGHAVRAVTLDFTPPALAWADPTPAEGAKVSGLPVPVAATLSEPATLALNGQPIEAEPGAPLRIRAALNFPEGPAALLLEAADRAGNTARLDRRFDVGLTPPRILIDSPAEGAQTQEASATLAGHVESPDFLKPLQLAVNGSLVPVGADGRFSLPVPLSEGPNAFRLVARNAFGLEGRAERTLSRHTTPFEIQIDFPLEGMATPLAKLDVRGRVLRAGTWVAVNGAAATVDPVTLVFTAEVALQPGPNTITATGEDGAGNQGQASVHVLSAPPQDPAATYRWDLPVGGSTSRLRAVRVQGLADLPGVVAVRVNGQPMLLSGAGREGRFEGELRLEAKGRNALLLEVRTLDGRTLTERRDVFLAPELPRIRLSAPESARPGDVIPIQVGPEPGTALAGADLSWNGRLLARLTAPFGPVMATVPADAAPGARIPVEALATSMEGEQVTARSSVAVYGQGALLVEAYDDRQGLHLSEGVVSIEGGATQALDARGKAALATALPQNWIRVSRPGHSPVWRSAALQVGGLQAVVDARLTPLEGPKELSSGSFKESYGKGALQITFPSGAFTTGQIRVTALSAQGLPGLLPSGWSALSAWWLDVGDQAPSTPGMARLSLPPGAPQDGFSWARWDEARHLWFVLGASLQASELGNLPLPGAGGYALVIPDAAPATPPAALPGAQLLPSEATAWREGLRAAGSVDPSMLTTSEAIRGAQAKARFNLSFEGQAAIPSGTLIQVDVLESYALLDSALIEPEGFTQDAVASRWILGVDLEGAPTLKAAQDLGLELPLRMSRAFQENELVEGRISVGFYHDGVQLSQVGSGLLDASGGTLARDGIRVTVVPNALAGTALLRLGADAGDPALLWPELAGKGALLKSFSLDVVGTLTQGFNLRFDDFGVPTGDITPLLIQRRAVQGSLVAVAVGELAPDQGGWTLRLPEGAGPLLEGGSFGVLLPSRPWAWISGTALVPSSAAAPLIQRLGAKAKLAPLKQASAMGGESDTAVADALVEAGFLSAVSGPGGAFAVPAFLPEPGGTAALSGERRDLGLRGTLASPVPARGQTLRLATMPFRLLAVLPAEGAEVSGGAVVQILSTTAMDPAALEGVRLYVELPAASGLAGKPAPPQAAARPKSARASKAAQGRANAQPSAPGSAKGRPKARRAAPKGALLLQSPVPDRREIPLRRSLSLDGRTLLAAPMEPLGEGASCVLQVEGLRSLAGEGAPPLTRRFHTAKREVGEVDFSRIRLTYPDENLNVTATIPEGSVPPWSIVSLEATEMGATGQGVMRPAGDLVFPMKASLGERILVTVQLRDGRTASARIGRYVSDDGRTMVGVDGGRVEGPGGLAIVVPEGALAGAVELRVEPMAAAPAVAEGTTSEIERILPGLTIRSEGPVDFRKPPRLELPRTALPEGLRTASDPVNDFGNGPIALFRTERRILPDGTEDEFHVLFDTARISEDGTKVVSLGGLRLPDAREGTLVQTPALALQAPGATPIKAVPAAKGAGGPERMNIGVGNWALSIFMMGFPQIINPPLTYYYNAGTVYRNWNGLGPCGGTASAGCYGALPYAEIHRHRGVLDANGAARGRLARGRILALADEKGRYANVGGMDAQVEAGQRFIALFAVDPRTGETSVDPGGVTAESQGLPRSWANHSLLITSQGGNPFDPALTAPRLRAQMVDAQGNARSVFAAGESATLKVSTEPGSQPVVRGKVSGSLTSDFGALPAELPVTLTQEGSWKVDILGWSAKPVQGATSLEVMVTSGSDLGPSLPGLPRVISKSPEGGDKDLDPSTVIRVAFSEPIHPDPGLIKVTANGAAVPFRLLSRGRPVGASDLAQDLWIAPDQRLGLGSEVNVELGALQDSDVQIQSLAPVAWSFTIRGADEIGSLSGIGTWSNLVVHGGRLYAVEDRGAGYYFDGYQFHVDEGLRMQGIRVVDVSDPSRPSRGLVFGGQGSWDPMSATATRAGMPYLGPFHKATVGGLRVVTGVPVGEKVRDLLLVATRPWLAQEILSGGDPDIPGATAMIRFRHNALWVFDVTGDGADVEAAEGLSGVMQPKLLLVTSMGASSENWIKGLGGAGGVLGGIRLRGGLTMWDAEGWRASLESDAAAPGAGGLGGIRTRAGGRNTGYYPDPESVVAANGFYAIEGRRPSVMSAVVTEADDGKPLAYAAMGYAEGKLIAIDGKVGDPEALATFMSGGPMGLDGRMQDISFAIDDEKAAVVEAFKGTYQGPQGGTTGVLLLVGTNGGPGGGRLWVLQPSRTAGGIGATQLAYADLPARITKITADPQKMLVGVTAANGKGYVFDLKRLVPESKDPMTLAPLLEFAAGGAFVISDGLLYTADGAGGAGAPSLRIKNIDGVQIRSMVGVPVLVDASHWGNGASYGYNQSAPDGAQASPGLSAPEAGPVATKLIYALTEAQGVNNGYPALRHYYPDLGEMHLSGLVEYADPRTFEEMTAEASEWRMVGEAKLFDGGAEIPGAAIIRGLKILHGDTGDSFETISGEASRVYGDGDKAKLDLDAAKRAMESAGSSPIPPNFQNWNRKFAYAPFAFWLDPAAIKELEPQMRLDETGRFRVKVRLRLFKKVGDQETACPDRQYEFLVKFNSNTTLFDVIRGGVWHYDPKVSSTDPTRTADNPTNAALAPFFNPQLGARVQELNSELGRRMSWTTYTRDHLTGGPLAGNEAGDVDPDVDLFDWKLDRLQQELDRNVLPLLRRRVYSAPGQDGRATRLHLPDRPTFQVPAGGALDGRPQLSGDPFGAFGYRTAHVVNAVQLFGRMEADGERNRDTKVLWAKDPAARKDETHAPAPATGQWVALDPVKQIDARIMPMVRQHLKTDGGDYNPFNVLVHYLVAYPRLRESGSQGNGLYPINTLITRDLLLGPMGVSSEGESPLGQSLPAQRKAIDEGILAANALKEGDSAKPLQSRNLEFALARMDVLVDKGGLYQKGLGLLQLALNRNWHQVRQEDGQGYRPFANDHVRYLMDDPRSFDYREVGFNANLISGLSDFLLAHHRATRLDLLVNGVQNNPEEAEEAAQRLQRHLDRRMGTAQESDPASHVPVLSIYNISSKLYEGGHETGFLKAGDGDDIVVQKRATAEPAVFTGNRDGVRLIAALRAAVEVVWNPNFVMAHRARWVISSDPIIRAAQEQEAKWHLDRLRENITLHAHSQGAIIAAVAQSRLGNLNNVLDGTGGPLSVAAQIRLATYGGGANMHDWGAVKWFKTYTHHVNQNDVIADLVGMLDPYQQGLVGGIVRTPVGLLGGGHSVRIIQGPNPSLILAWLSHHRVVLHPSKAWVPNTEEHNMVEGYICNADQESDAWVVTPLLNKFVGPRRCNDQPPPSGGQ